MTIDLKTLKASAQLTADRCPELLVTVPAGVMLELIKDVERYRFLRETDSWEDESFKIKDFDARRSASIVNARDEVSNASGEDLDRAVDCLMAAAKELK